MKGYGRKLLEAMKKDPGQVVRATKLLQPKREPKYVIQPGGEKDPIPRIIEQVAQDYIFSERADKPAKKGVDLSAHEESLRLFLAECIEAYDVAFDDWVTRDNQRKPKKRLENNWPSDNATEFLHDYGDDAVVGQSDWSDHYERFYFRGRGNPGRARDPDAMDVVVPPLYEVYWLARDWWIKNVDSRGFNPKYPPEYENGPRSEFGKFNPAGRFLYLIASEIDPRYTPKICANIKDTLKRKRRKRINRRE